MNGALITRDDSRLSINFTDEAVALKDRALEASALIAKVDDAASQANAVEAQTQLYTLKQTVEKARKIAKQPWIDAGRNLDSACESFVKEVQAELARISGLIGEFQEIEAAKQRAAEQALRLEQERIAREKREAELSELRRQAQEREALEAKQREIDALAEKARSEKQQKALEAQRVELDRQKALSEAKSHAELDRINAQASEAQKQLSETQIAAPVRAKGQRVSEEFEIEVFDVWALARAHPACVEITPRLTQIKEMLKAQPEMKIAGVRAKKVIKAGVTASRRLEPINV